MRRVEAARAVLLDHLQQWEIHHPAQRHHIQVDQPQSLAHAVAQAEEDVVGDGDIVRDKEQQVAGLAAQVRDQAGKLVFAHESGERRLRPLRLQRQRHQALRAVLLGKLGQLVQLFARGRGQPRHAQALHNAAAVQRVVKDLEAAQAG